MTNANSYSFSPQPFFTLHTHKGKILIRDQQGFMPRWSQVEHIIEALQELIDDPYIIEEHNEAREERLNREYENYYNDLYSGSYNCSKKKKKSGKGYVYLIECGGFHKIGITRSKKAKNRLDAYKTANPFPIHILFCKIVKNYRETEKKIITKFQHKLKRGEEWFKFSEKDIRRILNYLNKRTI